MAKKFSRKPSNKEDVEVEVTQPQVKTIPLEPLTGKVLPPLDPLYELTPLERFNQLPTYTTKLTNKHYSNIILHYLLMRPDKFKEIAQNVSKLSILEAQIVKGLAKSIGKSEEAHDMEKYYADRAFGKSKQGIEHTGPDGTPMQLMSGSIQSIMDEFSPEEIAAIRKIADEQS